MTHGNPYNAFRLSLLSSREAILVELNSTMVLLENSSFLAIWLFTMTEIKQQVNGFCIYRFEIYIKRNVFIIFFFK